MTDGLTLHDIRGALRVPGLDIRLFERVDSTNTLLRSMAEEGAAHGTVIIASSQSAGRGRLGRSFFSPEGTGLYMSVLLRPELSMDGAALITPAAAVAVCRAIEDFSGKRAGIKWVNDVMIEGKKVCGILTEARANASGGLDFAVLGIGVNVSPPAGGFPAELSQTAASVLDAPASPAPLASGILNSLFELLPEPDAASFIDEYRLRSVLTGQRIRVLSPAGSYSAAAMDVDANCRLIVRREDGSLETLNSGEVKTALYTDRR